MTQIAKYDPPSRQQVRATAKCPTCRAGRFRPCVNPDGSGRKANHSARVAAAAEQLGLQSPFPAHSRAQRNKRSAAAAERLRDRSAVTPKARVQRHEEKRWSARSGPLSVRFICPFCGGPHAASEHNVN